MTTNPTATLAAARDVIRREGAGVLSVAEQVDETFLRVVDLLLECRGKVFVTGSGTSGAVARRMAHLLSVCGTPALFLPGMDALHGTMGAVAHGDVLITISHGGESDELNQLSERVQRRGVPVIALTAQAQSTLGRLADVTVIVDAGPDVDPGGLVAMGSTLVAAVWGDALAYILMRARGYGWEEVLFTHPAGAVGRRTAAPEALPGLEPAADAREG
ncbi:KpsF/GutQ family sugar-phosphate isomerase [Georgenia thermotolerans]|uniref:SIS domain-containing protein n=1 Tax=Georgenia thermotolerans TaxID=527326 RepID=A0A7J5UUJ3_9MICO|nr:SIS domain-containing protein [Georgenia thermotolerans]KAE8765948.1 SIS domain-containing protein [Georgenia thermotolerans]